MRSVNALPFYRQWMCNNLHSAVPSVGPCGHQVATRAPLHIMQGQQTSAIDMSQMQDTSKAIMHIYTAMFLSTIHTATKFSLLWTFPLIQQHQRFHLNKILIGGDPSDEAGANSGSMIPPFKIFIAQRLVHLAHRLLLILSQWEHLPELHVRRH